MVLKLRKILFIKKDEFESSVNSDGTQTNVSIAPFGLKFESSVNFNSYQTNLFLGNRK